MGNSDSSVIKINYVHKEMWSIAQVWQWTWKMLLPLKQMERGKDESKIG